MVAILGSGIAGLTAAFQLAEKNIDFEVFESSEHIGGKIRSERRNGFLIEHGPYVLRAPSPLLHHILERCNLRGHRIFVPETSNTHFVARNRTTATLPQSLVQSLASNYFSTLTKLRLTSEVFRPKPVVSNEESVAQFVRQRLGNEVLDYAIDPIVSGFFAGNPELLSVKHAFPHLCETENKRGSVIHRLLSIGNISEPAFSFTEGLQMLPMAMSQPFTKLIHTQSHIRTIIPVGKRFRIDIARGNHEETRHFDAVISTLPLPDLVKTNLEVDFDLAPLSEVTYAPIHIVAMGFNYEDIGHSLDGSGILFPGDAASKRILGTIFTSTLFPSHAPAGKILLTTLLGGTPNTDLMKLPFEILEELVLSDLSELLGVYGDPIHVQHIQWHQGLPQYNLGYGVVKALLNNLEAIHPGLYFAGNYREGVSVVDAMESGYTAAQNALKLFA